MASLLIWGAGAIGGVVGGLLARSEQQIVLVDTWKDHVDQINSEGLNIRRDSVEMSIPVTAVLPAQLAGRHDVALLCVRSQHTASAIALLDEHVPENAPVVSFQNGLNHAAVIDALGKGRCIDAMINFSADCLEPGRIEYGGIGHNSVGELGGGTSARVEKLQRLLTAFDPQISVSGNIDGLIWGKLAFSALLLASALTDATIAEMLEAPRFREVLWQLAHETVMVARAIGIEMEASNGFDPSAFEKLLSEGMIARSFLSMTEHYRHSSKSHSGVWTDIAIRKKRSEATYLLAPVLRLGVEAGTATRKLTAMVQLFEEVEAGIRPLGFSNLVELERA